MGAGRIHGSDQAVGRRSRSELGFVRRKLGPHDLADGARLKKRRNREQGEGYRPEVSFQELIERHACAFRPGGI